MGQSNFSIRGEYRARLAWENDNNLTDTITTLGVQYHFGRSSHDPGVPPTSITIDTDGDRVNDKFDKCPNTRAGARIDVYGCEIRDIISLPGVNFETGLDRLLPGAEYLLRDAAATLNKYPVLHIEVAGYTDNVGNDDLNLGLSMRFTSARSRSASPARAHELGSNDADAGTSDSLRVPHTQASTGSPAY